jgi:tRNA(Ile)-lysidine synthase
VAAVRVAVRRALVAGGPPGVLVACSGGADSVALAAAVAFEAPKLGVPAGLVTVDHGLQAGSAGWAADTAALGRALGLDPVLVRTVTVGTAGGPEAAARTARYEALAAAAASSGRPAGAPGGPDPGGPDPGGPDPGGLDLASPGSGGPDPGAGEWPVLFGHTLDDQAETVLLGLGRGSGPRSIAGMRPVDGRWWRPLLGLRRATTRQACADQSLPYRDDPHNTDPRFTRARLRTEVVPLLEDVLHGGVAEALARTADLLRADLDALDALAAALTPAGDTLDAAALAAHPAAIRTRVLRNWAGAPLTAAHLRAVDALLTDWHGQGPVALPSGRLVTRASGMLHLARSTC